MAIGTGWAENSFVDASFDPGAWFAPRELRVVCLQKTNGQLYASETVEYALWPVASLTAIGAPSLQGSTSTDALGQLVIDVSGEPTLIYDTEVYIAIRQAQGGADYDDDDFGFGTDRVTIT